jgi:hypothetical protein
MSWPSRTVGSASTNIVMSVAESLEKGGGTGEAGATCTHTRPLHTHLGE